MDCEFHEAANEFPLLNDKRLNELADDIEQNGLREPIYLHNNKILDGRNRYKACQLKNITPKYETLPSDIDPFTCVWSLNGERRDLAAAQRYGIWKNCMEKSATWQAEQQRIQEEANQKRADAAKQQENRGNQYTATEKPEVKRVDHKVEVNTQPVYEPAKYTGKTNTAKAAASKTNRGTVERMDRLYRNRKDLYDKVVTGELAEAAAIREMRRDENKTKLEEIASKESEKLNQEYDVVVIDPPWPMQKIDRDVRPNQSDFDYPTMTEGELAALEIPAADNCHLWLWTTQKFMPTAHRLLKEWGFRYLCTFVWHKPGGFQPIGLPQYNCEFALYARKGTPEFYETKSFYTCFTAPRGKHSEKPQEFYDMVYRVTAGKRLDMFNRRKIEGFDGWGKESE